MRSLDNSDIEDADLRHASWYQPGIPRYTPQILASFIDLLHIFSFIVHICQLI